VYQGDGVNAGIEKAGEIEGVSSATSISAVILNIVSFILNLALLLAVVAIIVAGIYLIVSNGDEGQKDKAKRIIFYVIIGIIVILLSRVIVSFVISVVA